jgi:hypothetical protein
MDHGWDDDLADLEIDDEGPGQGGWKEDKDLFSEIETNEEQGDALDRESSDRSPKEGWDENDDLNFDDPVIGNSGSFTVGNRELTADDRAASETNEGGWEADEELFGDEEELNVDGAMHAPPLPPPPPSDDLLKELKDYVRSLGRMLSSVNAILEYEYNTPEKAQELVQYYDERPGLAEYTRTKEVPRMSYQVILPNGHVETDKEIIAQNYLPDGSLLARCANQSLLADLLHVLTGPDLVVRPQFLAICVAQTCQFRLHYGDHGRDMVQVNCMLQLSLPVAEGPRLNIATIRTTIVFSPRQVGPPMVKFKIDKIVIMLKENQYSELEKVVDFLRMMEGHFDEVLGRQDAALQNAPADIFRDAFLEQSQQIMNQSKAGMKSALKDMESVIGLKSKLKAVQVGISKFLPSTDVLLEADEEARRLAAQREAQQGHFLHPPSVAFQREEPPPLAGQSSPPLPHTAAISGLVSSDDVRRPRSILGGLVKTGWGALAKSITIPDEDPAIYGTVPQQEIPTMLYRREELPKEVAPLLHQRKEEHAGPQLYGGPDPPVRLNGEIPNVTKGPENPSTYANLDRSQGNEPGDAGFKLDPSFEGEFGDGWDDDLDLTIDAEENVNEEEHVDRNRDPDSIVDNDAAKGRQTEVAPVHHKQDIVSTPYVAPTKSPVPSRSTVAPAKSPTRYQLDMVSIPQVSPTMIPDPSRSSTALAKSPTLREANASPSKIPSFAGISQKPLTRRPLIADITYNPEDDIIPTRKRWVNPRADRASVAR